MKSRSELRDIIVKVLYQANLFDEANISYDIDKLIFDQLELQNDFVNDSVKGVLEHKTEIYSIANSKLNNWTMDRLNKVDQAIVALGIYELKYTETPAIVAINEAIELSKIYSDDAVVKIVNGVLDKVFHDLEK